VPPAEDAFNEIVSLIQVAREHSLQFVNSELVGLYWQIGKHISSKLKAAEWGEGVVDQLARHLARTMPGLRGFTRRNLFRMRQFFETYASDEKVSALVTQLPWTHNLIVLGQSKRPEEREFYLRMAIQERWSKRDLEQQFRRALFERTILDQPKVSPAVRQIHGEAAASVFKEVVEYALSRSLSPALIAEYQTQLPDKELLAAPKLHEFYLLNAAGQDTGEDARQTKKEGQP
jgi:predicted nuclease of restriction endonuclease-like (RecB) superfamily